MDQKYIDRFNAKYTISDNGCWEWTACLDRKGYGLFKWPGDGKGYLAHRFSAKYIGNMNIENLCVCHKCDNPKCVNPAHFFIGTKGDNTKDMIAKGRNILPPRSKGVKVETPLGEFPSIVKAAKAHKCDPALIQYNLKNNPTEFYYISKEEYIMLTGKEI